MCLFPAWMSPQGRGSENRTIAFPRDSGRGVSARCGLTQRSSRNRSFKPWRSPTCLSCLRSSIRSSTSVILSTSFRVGAGGQAKEGLPVKCPQSRASRTRVSVGPEFGGCLVCCLVGGGLGMACFHYMGGVGAGWGLGDGGFVPGAGVCADGGQCSGL